MSKELEDKRYKSLCFWHDKRFVPGHRCKTKRLYLFNDEESDDEGMIK